MLAQETVRAYGDRARFVVQDFGASPLAERFGIDKYPAIFVDDALVARPEDFYAWGGPGSGKYVPWSEVANRRKFQGDLKRMIDLRLAGREVQSAAARSAGAANVAARNADVLPAVDMTDLDGKRFNFAELRGKPVIVEFWATWCPICLDTLTWMKGSLAPSARVVAVAVDSERKEIDRVVARIQPRAKIVIASDEVRRAFSGPPAVPTLVIADAQGRIAKVFYGAPSDLHEQIERELAKLR
ncbi:MAG: Redoxin domain protein [Acidobacteria bacterium]|nr:Redoxin domain protein [Acidobacteriota bacterium]